MLLKLGSKCTGKALAVRLLWGACPLSITIEPSSSYHQLLPAPQSPRVSLRHRHSKSQPTFSSKHNSARSLWFLNSIYPLLFSFTGLQSTTPVWFHFLFYLAVGIMFLVDSVLCIVIHKELQRKKMWNLEIYLDSLDSGHGKEVPPTFKNIDN